MAASTRLHWQERIIASVKATGRRLLEKLERRKAAALRRNPARLTRGLSEARSVLILCQGNVIRSVFGVAIRSAGLATQPGWRPHPRVIARCSALNIDLREHSSVAVTETMVRRADVVLIMELSQAVAVTRRFPRARRKTFLLSCLAPEVPMDIEDPAGKDDATVDACLDHVAQALKPVIEILAHRGTAAA